MCLKIAILMNYGQIRIKNWELGLLELNSDCSLQTLTTVGKKYNSRNRANKLLTS